MGFYSTNILDISMADIEILNDSYQMVIQNNFIKQHLIFSIYELQVLIYTKKTVPIY